MKPALRRLFLNDRFIFILIFANSITIFFNEYDQLNSVFLAVVRSIDGLITLLFAFEIVVKVDYFGWKGYFKSSWNLLDFSLVILSLPSVVLLFFDASLANLSFLLVLRVSRVFKFFRFFRFIPGIDQLLSGIQRALKDSVLVLLGFAVYIFVIAVLSSHLFKGVAPEFFGDPMSALYSTFKVFTIEGWYEMPDLIATRTSYIGGFFTKLYFVVLLMTGGILGLSLVNSIFVDAMIIDNTEELEHKVDELNKKVDLLLKMQAEATENKNNDNEKEE